ncbi:NADH-quinone oxidoreductase subunit N [Buchnera aphidicola (Mindarus keteleerifoliae)]|uniref:NADH-quinone oxidoreductase subunit N n=1 Tax=Buchnera aphidicola TaxID=9 RepID=UPI0031B6943E
MIVFKQLFSLLPALILMLVGFISFLFMSFKKNLNLIKNLNILGFILSLLSLFLVYRSVPIKIGEILFINFFSIVYLGVLLLIGLCSCILFLTNKKRYIQNPENFFLLINLAIIGAMFAIISNNMIIMFIGIELMSLPMLALSGYFVNEKKSVESSLKYLILSTISSCFLLFGISLIYCISGNFNFFHFNELSIFSSYDVDRIVLFAWCFILTGFGIKIAIFPFHSWISNIYEGISFSSLLFFSTIIKIVSFIILINFFIFFPKNNLHNLFFLIQILSFFSILLGNILALFEKNIRKLLAYSSIAYFGSLLISVVTLFDNKFALESFGINIVNYVLSSVIFIGILNYISTIDNNHYHNGFEFYKGLFWRNPILSILMTISIFSFAGIPFTIGFFGKFFLFLLIIEQKFYFLGISFLLGSVLSMYYYLRIVVNMFINEPMINKKNLLIKKKISNNWIFTFFGFLMIILSMSILFFGINLNFLINLFSI